MNTMEITKIVGGVCSTLLAFLLIKTGAEAIIHGASSHGEAEFAYAIEVPDADSAPAEEEEPAAEVDIAAVMASADAAAGESQFRACAACHQLEAGANGVGPHLYGVVDRQIASVDGYSYSDALASIGAEGEIWDADHLNRFLTNPSGYAPGTKMAYRGMRDLEDRANLIAYLESVAN